MDLKSISIKYVYKNLPLQGLEKFMYQVCIFGMQIYHLVTLVRSAVDEMSADEST
jgi:hypothetical protein